MFQTFYFDHGTYFYFDHGTKWKTPFVCPVAPAPGIPAVDTWVFAEVTGTPGTPGPNEPQCPSAP
jgi:hypothetical protein